MKQRNNCRRRWFETIARGYISQYINTAKYFKTHSVIWADDRLLFLSNNRFQSNVSIKDFKIITKSKLDGCEVRKAYINFMKRLSGFDVQYKGQKKIDFIDIAKKNNIDIGISGSESKIKFDGYVKISTKNGNFDIKLITFAKRDENGDLIEKSKDVTGDFNIQEPKTDEEKQKKAFYDDIVEYINKDEVIKGIFISDANKENKN